MTRTDNRVPLSRPLTPKEEHAVGLLAEGLTYREIAEVLECAVETAKVHVKNAGAKIPGDLPLQMRVVAWVRGAKTYKFPTAH